MTVSFKIGLDDLIAAQSFVVSKSKFHKRNKLIGSIVAVILAIIIKFTIFKVHWIMMVILSTALFFAIHNFIYKKAMVDQIKRLAKNNPSIVNSECTLTVSESGVLREFKNSTNKLEWDEIKLVSEDDDRYILYLSDIKTAVIKKKPHNMSERETRIFNQLLRSYFDQYNIEIE